jgi:hypothetical protein
VDSVPGRPRTDRAGLLVRLAGRVYAATCMDDVLVMLACRRCSTPFFVCRKCYRGQAYCGDTCRAAARVVSARAARKQHQSSDAGRLDHRDRQRAYRIRQRARVMDHTSPAVPALPKMSPPRSGLARPAPVRVARPTCTRCGCESAWVRWGPRPATRAHARRRARKGQEATAWHQAHPRLMRDAPPRRSPRPPPCRPPQPGPTRRPAPP